MIRDKQNKEQKKIVKEAKSWFFEKNNINNKSRMIALAKNCV